MEEKQRSQGKLEREFSAGGVVIKRQKSKILWLITRSNPSALFPKAVWRLPKGWLDDEKKKDRPGLYASGKKRAKENTFRKVAIREVAEEGGVKAKILAKVGTERYFFTVSGRKILKYVTFYLMEWEKDLSEGPGPETGKVVLFPFTQARTKLSYSGEKKILDKAKGILDSGIQENLL